MTILADHKWKFQYNAGSNSAHLLVVVGKVEHVGGKIVEILAEESFPLGDQKRSSASIFSHDLDIREHLYKVYALAGVKIGSLPDVEKYPGIYVEVRGSWVSNPGGGKSELIRHPSLGFGLMTQFDSARQAGEARLQLNLEDGSPRNNLGRGGRLAMPFKLYPDTAVRMFSQFLLNSAQNQFHDPQRRSYLIHNVETKTGFEGLGVSTFRYDKRVLFEIAAATWEIFTVPDLELETIVVDPVASGHGGG